MIFFFLFEQTKPKHPRFKAPQCLESSNRTVFLHTLMSQEFMDGFCHKTSVCFCSIIQPVDVSLFRVYMKWVMMIKQIFDFKVPTFFTCYEPSTCTNNWSLETNFIYVFLLKQRTLRGQLLSRAEGIWERSWILSEPQ